MRLISSIAISVAAGAAIAAGAARYVAANAAAPAFWQHDPVALLWLAAGGPVMIGLAAFALAAFILVTAGVLRDIATARARLEWDGADGHFPHPATEPAPQLDWAAIFAGTAFAPIADQLLAAEFRAAPLSLLRVLRVEVWRVYAKRLVGIEILAIAACAGLVLVRPAWLSPPSVAAGAGWEAAAALLLLAAVAAAWLLLDEAIGWMGSAITRSSAAWPRSVSLVEAPAAAPYRVLSDGTQNRIEQLVGAFEQLVDLLAARPDPLARVADELARTRTELCAVLERVDERLRAPPAAPAQRDDGDPSIWPRALAGITDALADLARAMEKLSLEAAAARWDELEGAVRTMGASLDGIAAALQAQPPRPPGPRTVTDRLEALLEEISEHDFAAPRAASR